MSVHPAHYLRATVRMGGKMIVVVKCRLERGDWEHAAETNTQVDP